MATLADELLNDFEDSDSEQGEEKVDLPDSEQNGHANGGLNGLEGMEVDANEDEDEVDVDEEASARKQLDLDDNEDETKAKVEKMKLGGVNDVRNVAGLMKTLQPVLEVCQTHHRQSHTVIHAVTADPASNVKCRK
jgi:U4/U6 small nuclear ribonucleoprotein PRP31